MPICLDVVVVAGVSLQVHAACVPVSLLWHALRAPMRPDAKLGVAKPFRHSPLFEGIPCRHVRPRCRHILCLRKAGQSCRCECERTTFQQVPSTKTIDTFHCVWILVTCPSSQTSTLVG